MKVAMRWDFSRALGVIGLFAAAARVALALILGDSGGDLLSAVGTGILILVAGLLVGAGLDVAVRVRRNNRLREPGRHAPHRKR